MLDTTLPAPVVALERTGRSPHSGALLPILRTCPAVPLARDLMLFALSPRVTVFAVSAPVIAPSRFFSMMSQPVPL